MEEGDAIRYDAIPDEIHFGVGVQRVWLGECAYHLFVVRSVGRWIWDIWDSE